MKKYIEIGAIALLATSLSTDCPTGNDTGTNNQIKAAIADISKQVKEAVDADKHVTTKEQGKDLFPEELKTDRSKPITIPIRRKLNLKNTAEYIRNKRVVVAGENHLQKTDNEAFVKLLPTFKKMGFTDLGMELDVDHQSFIDEYQQSGDERWLDFLEKRYRQGENLKGIIITAIRIGLKITCIDSITSGSRKELPPRSFLAGREERMFGNVERILNSGNRKLVTFNGLAHATYQESWPYPGYMETGEENRFIIDRPLGHRLVQKYGYKQVGLIDMTGCDDRNNYYNSPTFTFACMKDTEKEPSK